MYRYLCITGVLLLSGLFVAGSGALPLLLHLAKDHGCDCKHDHHEEERDDSRDCPECQSLLALSTVNPSLFDDSACSLRLAETADGVAAARPFNTLAKTLPAIRAPPVLPV